MKDYLYTLAQNSGSLAPADIILHILASAVIGIAIYISYWFTHLGTAYSKKFNVSLITLAVLTGTVMTVIGNNIVLSLGMVGALSIVRFRTAVKDTRDTVYIFWSIIVGICCGVGDYFVAFVGTAIVFVILLLLGRVRNENRMLLVIRGAKAKDSEIESTVFDYYKGKAMLKVKNTTVDSVELIYEMSRKQYQKAFKNKSDIATMLYEIGGTEYVNIVAQSDEITG